MSDVHTQRSWGRRHMLFLVALALGVAIRVVVMVAYRPALLFPDAFHYLKAAHHFYLSPTRPGGYSLLLWPLAHVTDSLAAVAGLQHLVGLGLAVASYAFLLRRGLPAWGATLAVLPLLLDPLQLVLEHYVLSDVFFEAAIGAACLLLLWQPRPGYAAVVAAGALAGYSGLVRGAGTFVIAVFVVAVLCLRVGWVKVVAFVVAAVVPLALYMTAFDLARGSFATSTAGPRFLYARLAPVVHCRGLPLPAYERSLCPRVPVGQRASTDYFMWGHKRGPAYHVQAPAGMTTLQVIKDFDKRVVRAEPRVYATASLTDFAHGFEPLRTFDVPGYPSSYWLFEDHYWALDPFIAHGTLSPARLHGTSSDATAASFLTSYREHLWTPGPLLAVLMVLGTAAAFGLGRARRSGDRVAAGLLTAACVLPLLIGAALSGFSWRYQLPQLMLLPLAGAVGVAALVRGRSRSREPVRSPYLLLDRITGLGMRLLPGAWRLRVLTYDGPGGRLPAAAAVVVGLLAGVLSMVVVAGSGWASARYAALGGLVIGLVLAIGLVLSCARAHADAAAHDRSHHRPPGGPRDDEQPVLTRR